MFQAVTEKMPPFRETSLSCTSPCLGHNPTTAKLQSVLACTLRSVLLFAKCRDVDMDALHAVQEMTTFRFDNVIPVATIQSRQG
ncbi:hypothetical protein SCLCIDRAFT_1206995 [Scleroderma citrinum Foug A]|uniref:Uncharacterized protein n=1 Tax=Scleroderma citrinum Foug A TaxID=1036808 RepID=A0A0C3AAM0_9AGAM|nr:hypothetical protein SCLCIDRAFT_1206995 [Scleroderma citrinum Foug A]